MTEKDYILCTRKHGKAQIPGSVVRKCEECDHDVFVSPSGVNMIKKEDLLIVCMSCVEPNADMEIPDFTEEQVAEIKKYLGRKRHAL